MSRRGQAVVEVLALAPALAALVLAFGLAATRIAGDARAARLAEAARLADAAGEPPPVARRSGQATVLVVALALPLSVLAVEALLVLAARAAG